jgi:acetyl-CoA decarbonylase/synthase complex subunit epsilon
MAVAEPWQKAEIPGPKRAMVVTKPDVIAALAKRAKHPILIVGHSAVETSLEGKKLIDYLVQFAEKGRIPVVATAQTAKEFLKRKLKPAAAMPAVDIGNRLADPKWMGIDGKGQHDLAFFAGLPYYMEWMILSGLKHYAPTLKTITLDNVYHPHASWSFANISHKDLAENLKVIIEQLEQGEK